ncbi:MAG: heme NO-binding domain-containing protein [Verrucomicrobia bacterium]|nr:heme NO-binding domain-containing protein [Verrucomicrobiota bacterium]
MYGMVNKAVQDLVTSRFGAEKWQEIREKAGVDDELFVTNQGYPDELTYRLVEVASSVLQLPAEQVLQAFGEYWILETAQVGYGAMMRAGGKSLREFLVNLPNFHTRVSMIFPHLQPPRFGCTEITDSSLELHYHTHRPGLLPFVLGLLSGLGKMYSTPVQVETLASRADGADHDVLRVRWGEPELSAT